MKKLLVTSSFFLIVALGIFTLYPKEIRAALGNLIRSGNNISSMASVNWQATSTPAIPTATSTWAYLQSGLANSAQIGVAVSTTTLIFPSEELRSLTAYLSVVSTTTNGGNGIGEPQGNRTTLNIERQASDDGINFYTYDDSTVNPSATYPNMLSYSLSSTTAPIPWTFIPSFFSTTTNGTAWNLGATTTKAVNLNLLPARFTKLIITMPATSTQSTTFKTPIQLYVNLVGQINVAK